MNSVWEGICSGFNYLNYDPLCKGALLVADTVIGLKKVSGEGEQYLKEIKFVENAVINRPKGTDSNQPFTKVGKKVKEKLYSLVKKNKIDTKKIKFIINQIREKIGVIYGNPETTPGGRALKFYASARLEIRRITSIKGPENSLTGNRVKVKVVKNKMAPPFRIAEFDILFNEGISRTGSAIDMATEFNVIDKKGAWFSYKGERLGQGREAVREELKTNTPLLEEIESLIMEHHQPQEKPAQPEPVPTE